MKEHNQDCSMRKMRKLDHLKYAMDLTPGPLTTGLEEIHLIHVALPDYDLAEIELTTEFAGKKLAAPIFINAITGGNAAVKEINAALAYASRETGLGIAVGSQRAALYDRDLRDTYAVVREVNPEGLVIGNLSATASLAEAEQAIEMIGADALQLHLNVAQELSMPEGDRTFKVAGENIRLLVEKLHVPVIVKEVGAGIGREAAKKLRSLGVQNIDISGAGGTNFVAIEHARQKESAEIFDTSLVSWGIPTACALLETRDLGFRRLIASGGIESALDIAKSLVLGADLVGMARSCLEAHYAGRLVEFLQETRENLRKIMLLLNAQNIAGLKGKSVVITGWVKDWVEQRNLALWKK